MDVPSDQDLVRRVRNGETQAYGEMVRRYQQSVFNVCWRVLQNRQDAEDLAQEAFIRAYERLDRFDIRLPFGPWINRIAANLSINAVNSRKTHFAIDPERDAQPSRSSTHPEAALDRSQQRRTVLEALALLPPNYRMAIELRHFQEMTYEEMAQSTGLPLTTVKSHLFRGRKMLARILKNEA